MAAYFEAGMLICFGISWPFAVYKSWSTKDVAGKSAVFLWFILLGYVCGIGFKVASGVDKIIAFYAVNLVLVATDIALYYRYRRRPARGAEGMAA
jgi:NhaP-type Na+/H+ or K+/H+ antiporter